MANSTQLTHLINKQPDPQLAEFKIWKNTRYLVAQNPATPDDLTTMPGYYLGRSVIPGPKYNPKLSEGLANPGLTMGDYQVMKNRHFIRFVDNRTTDGADESVQRGLYTVMTDEEADAYEQGLRKYYGIESQRVSS